MRLTDGELAQLLSALESDRVERKESLSDPSRVAQAICAFANDLPGHGAAGVVFVGAKDDGSCAGLSVTDDLLLRLAHIRGDGRILPLPTMSVEKRTVAGCELAVVTVLPSLAPPVRFEGRTWIRVGPRRAMASAEEERRLAERRRALDVPFDLSPLATADRSDLDLQILRREYLPSAVAPDVLAENERAELDQLRSLRFVDIHGTPTVLGILVLGTQPDSYVPGAYIQFLRVDGCELTDPIKDQKKISGPLGQQLDMVDAVLRAHVATSVRLEGAPRDEQRPDYPIEALRQLLHNAVMHRTYEGTAAPVRWTWFSDRIEVLSPGGPYGQVSVANFGAPGVTDYRNAHVAEALRVLGYVQRFGVGIATAKRELTLNGNPPLEFDVQSTAVLATVRRRVG